jgi:DNA-directed RNA polymerase specialized sigma24 family protein
MKWTDLQGETTELLIDMMQYKGQLSFENLAEMAFVVFTFRFREDVILKCRQVGRKWGYDEVTCDTLAEKTFERFWRYPFGFDKQKCQNKNLDNCIKFYLYRIAQRCFVDHYRELSGEAVSIYDGSEEVIIEFPDLEKLNISSGKKKEMKKIQEKIESALATLSPKHKIIYLTYKAYEKEGYKLPRSLLVKLREELSLSQDSIRVYKKQAFEAEKNAIENDKI